MFSFLFGSLWGIIQLVVLAIVFFAGRKVERAGWKSLFAWRNWRTVADDCMKMVTR